MELSKKTKEYWEEKDWEDLEKAENMAELFVVAKRIIERMEKPLAQVCGPISTGGLGSIDANLCAFNKKIKELQDKGLNMFDQMPFQISMKKLTERFSPDRYFDSILTDFYCPLFESGAISRFYFLPDWQSSKGAKWEHEQAKRLGIEIIYL
ncbi:MAG: DUF4406 domain-containing protein [Minisyncoccia bacterium]